MKNLKLIFFEKLYFSMKDEISQSLEKKRERSEEIEETDDKKSKKKGNCLIKKRG